MAGEGLFFSGVVLKNNRNLQQEEIARRQLAIQEENLNIRKQEAADRRRLNRQSGIASSSVDADYSGISDPRLKLEISKRASDFNKFVADNYDNNDPIIQSAIQDRRDELKLFSQYVKGLDSKLSIYDPLNPNAANLRYQTDADGNNMIDINKNNIFQELSDGTFNLSSRIASFENDFDGQVIIDETIPGYKATLQGMIGQYVDPNDGNTYKGAIPGERQNFTNSFTSNHLIKTNTNQFSSAQAEKDYFNEEFVINGTLYDGIEAYLLEKEGFTNTPSQTEKDRFDPKSEFFNEEDHVKYVNYLAEKVWERDTGNRILIKKKEEEEDKDALTKEEINFFTGPTKVTPIFYGDVKFKFDPGMYDDVDDRGITVRLVPQSLLPGQGERQEQFNKLYKEAIDKGSKSVQAKVTRIGLTTDNQKVAAVIFGNAEFLIPLEAISGEVKELKKGSIGYKIGQLDVSAAPQSIDTSKYN